MKPERWQKIDEILQAALDRQPDERAAFLDEACAGDDELRHEVESLLAREDSAEHFIETSAMKVVARDLVEEDLSGQQVSHYLIIKPIGEGGMGKVYLATDSKLNRSVAIKFLPEAFTADPAQYAQSERLRRFEQEARAASKLNHPNIVTIHEFGQSNGRHFIVTEYIAGQTLREKLKESPPDIPQIIDIVLQITSALKAAHAANIIHRDIKPENIMLRDDGVVKVLDFGIAKLQDRETEGWRDRGNEGDLLAPSLYLSVSPSLTQLGVVLGTASYMSPEQARGDDVDARSDLFSLGAVIYEMVTRQRLFEGRTQAEVLRSLASNDESPRIEKGLSDAPKELAAIVRLALKKDRDKRYASAQTMFRDLQRLQERLKTQRLRRTMKYVATGLAAAVAIVFAAFWFARGEVWEEKKMNDGHTAAVRRAVFSPDGRLLVSVSEDRLVIVWDFAQRKRLKTFTDHTAFVSSVDFSPDGKWFATGSYDNTVIVWNAEQLEKLIVLPEHRDQINAVAFSPDGKLLATSSSPDFQNANSDKRTVVWDTSRWEKVRELPAGTGGPLLFSPDSRLLFGDGQWDILTGQKVFDGKSGNWTVFSAGAMRTVRVGSAGEIDIAKLARPGELASGKLIAEYHVHQDFGRTVAFSPDEKLLATGSENIVLWETDTMKMLGRFEYDSIVWSVAFSPDGRWLVSTHGDGAILVWNVAERRRAVGFDRHGDAVRAVAISPDGKLIASAGEDRSVVIWNAQSGRKEMVLDGHQTRVIGVAFSPDGKWLASCDQGDGNLIRWDLETRQPQWKTRLPHSVSLTISPDGRWLATSQGVFDSSTGCVIFDFYDVPPQPLAAEQTAFSPDNRRLFLTTGGKIRVLDTANWQLIKEQTAGDSILISVSFSPDGSKLVTGSVEGTVRLWQAEPLRPLDELGSHDARIKATAFSNDGSEVVSCGDDKQIKLWNVEQRKLIQTIGDHSSPIYAIAFSKDGKYIVSGEHDHTVRIYRRHRTWFGSKVD